MNILVVAAHPDDEIIGMGGTLKKLSKKHSIKILFLAEGITSRRNSGHVNSAKYDVSRTELEKMNNEIIIRNNHATNALHLLNIKNIKFLDFKNLETDQLPLLKIVKEIENEIKKTKCDTIFTHHYNDLNLDHRNAYEATITAARPLPESKIQKILSFEIPASTSWRHPYNFKPNVFVDISKELSFKIKALKQYKNEIRKFPNPRSSEATTAIAKHWGSLSGFKAAESFELIYDRISKF
jgi:LmbE family N-acetylglucosaminyl deacetylase